MTGCNIFKGPTNNPVVTADPARKRIGVCSEGVKGVVEKASSVMGLFLVWERKSKNQEGSK